MAGLYPNSAYSFLAVVAASRAFASALTLLGALVCTHPAAGQTLESSASLPGFNALALHRLHEAGPDARPAPSLEGLRLPPAVDNSALPSFPPLFDQGDLESCTAVVSAYYQLTHAIGLRRGWDQSRLSDQNRFSPAWIYNLTNRGANIGVSLPRAYAALAEHGAVTLAALPYDGSPASLGDTLRNSEEPALRDQALSNRIDRFGLVDAKAPAVFLAELKRLLANGHLLSGSTAIEGWNRVPVAAAPGDTRSPHVGESICTAIDPHAPVSHAITLVGYNDDIWVDLNGDGRAQPRERGAFKIVNSWGTRDWNGGFRWLHYSVVARRGPAAGSHADSGDKRGAFWGDRVFWLLPRDTAEPGPLLASGPDRNRHREPAGGDGAALSPDPDAARPGP